MRAAVVAAVVFAIVVGGLVFLAAGSPALAHGTATPQTQPAAPQAADQSASPTAASCPQPGSDGPDLTGCPDSAPSATPSIGFGDLRRLESLPPQGWP